MPNYVTGVTSWTYDSDGDIFTGYRLHSSSASVVLRWNPALSTFVPQLPMMFSNIMTMMGVMGILTGAIFVLAILRQGSIDLPMAEAMITFLIMITSAGVILLQLMRITNV